MGDDDASGIFLQQVDDAEVAVTEPVKALPFAGHGAQARRIVDEHRGEHPHSRK